MRIVNLSEAKAHLSRLIEEGAKGEPFIIAKAGKPIAKVVPLHHAPSAARNRIGFLAGQFKVPPDFDRMGQPEVESMFGMRH